MSHLPSRSLPDTALVQEATKVVRTQLRETVLAHSYRTFLLGRAYAEVKKLPFDEEGLLLAALFHDVGLEGPFADRQRPFTEVSATQLRIFLNARGEEVRARSLGEAVQFHMQLLPRWSKGPESGLLHIGAWMDVMGLRSNTLAREQLRAVEERYPRAGFDAEFQKRLFRSMGSFRACFRLFFPATRS